MLYRFFIKNGKISGYCPIENIDLMAIDYDLTIDKDFENEDFFGYVDGDIVIVERPEIPDFIY